MSDTDVAGLCKAVEILTLTERRVLVLHYAEGLSALEVALVLDLSAPTVESILESLRTLARDRIYTEGSPVRPEGASRGSTAAVRVV